jgi:hypothetical protein
VSEPNFPVTRDSMSPAVAHLFVAALRNGLRYLRTRSVTPPSVETVAKGLGCNPGDLPKLIDAAMAYRPASACGVKFRIERGRVFLEDGTDGEGKPLALAVRQVFEHWQLVTGSPRSVLDSKRRTRIETRLREGYTVAELCRAASALSQSPWHNGDNPGRTKYLGIEHAFRDADTVDRWLANSGAGSTDPIEQARMEAATRKA